MAQARALTKWQLRDSTNQVIASWPCDTLVPLSAEVCAFRIDSLWGLMQIPDCLLLKPQFDSIQFDSRVGERFIFWQKKQGYGVLHLGGWQVLKSVFEQIKIEEKYILGRTQSYWQIFNGQIDNKKSTFQFDTLSAMSGGLRAVKPDGGCWGYIDSADNVPWGFNFDVAGNFIKNNAIVKKEGLWGLLQRDGEWALGAVFDKLTRLTDTTFLAQVANRQAILDRFGNVMLETQSPDSLGVRPDGFIFHRKGIKVGLWDANGCCIVPVEADYDQIGSLHQPDSVFVLEQDVCKGFADARKGLISCEPRPKFDQIFPMKEGLSLAKIKKRYGYIDREGYVRVANRYDTAQAFSEGMAAVLIKKKWAYINRAEEIKVQPYYEQAQAFANGVAIVRKKGKYGLVNTAGYEVHAPDLDSLWRLPSGYFVSVQKVQKGILTPQGQMVSYPKYDKIAQLPNTHFLVGRDDKWGVYKNDGSPLIPLLFSAIVYQYGNYWLKPFGQ